MRFIAKAFFLLILASSCLVAALPKSSGGRIVEGLRVITGYDFMIFLNADLIDNTNLSGKRSMPCSGTLIAPNAIVTAAHCVEGLIGFSRIEGAINKLGGTIQERRGISYTSINVTIHEYYNASTIENDIAVIIVKEKVNALGRKPIPMRIANNITGENLLYVAYGFGRRNEYESFSPILSQLQVENFPVDTCDKLYFNPQDERQICGYPKFSSGNICFGDSGGPLYGHDDRYNQVLVGIASFGAGDCDAKYPAVYTNIFQFKDWLKSKIPGLEEGLDVVYSARAAVVEGM